MVIGYAQHYYFHFSQFGLYVFVELTLTVHRTSQEQRSLKDHETEVDPKAMMYIS